MHRLRIERFERNNDYSHWVDVELKVQLSYKIGKFQFKTWRTLLCINESDILKHFILTEKSLYDFLIQSWLDKRNKERPILLTSRCIKKHSNKYDGYKKI